MSARTGVIDTVGKGTTCPLEAHFIEFRANDDLLWSIDTIAEESQCEAKARLLRDVAVQAQALGIERFSSLVDALRHALCWTPDQACVLAIAFVFPEAYAIEKLHISWDKPIGRGRPTRVERALWMLKWMNAWYRMTGRRPGINHSHFVRAFHAAAAQIGLKSRRGSDLSNVEKFLRQEREKFSSAAFRVSGTRPSNALMLTTPHLLIHKPREFTGSLKGG